MLLYEKLKKNIGIDEKKIEENRFHLLQDTYVLYKMLNHHNYSIFGDTDFEDKYIPISHTETFSKLFIDEYKKRYRVNNTGMYRNVFIIEDYLDSLKKYKLRNRKNPNSLQSLVAKLYYFINQ